MFNRDNIGRSALRKELKRKSRFMEWVYRPLGLDDWYNVGILFFAFMLAGYLFAAIISSNTGATVYATIN